MGKFEQSIVNQFVPKIKRAYVAFDPEYRLEQGNVRSKLEGKGFSIIEYTPTPHFRYIYEKEFRQVWDNGDEKELIVVVRHKKNLPIDMENFIWIDLRAKKLLPSIPDEIGSRLPSELLDQIYDEVANSSRIMTVDEISDLLLEKIAGTSKFVMNDEIDVLQFLLILVKKGVLDMPILKEMAISKIPKEYLQSLRIDSNALSSTNTFYDWLNSIWHDYVISVINGDKPTLDISNLKTEIAGLLSLGILTPVELKFIDIGDVWFKRWIRRKELDIDEIRAFKNELKEKVNEYTEFSEWVSTLRNISGMELRISDKDPRTLDDFLELVDFVDQKFSTWYLSNIGEIANRSAYFRPWTLDQILDHLRMRYKNKICLIVLDSLSFFAWLQLKDFLVRKGLIIKREEVVLTWIPTITNICRRSLLSGKRPIELAKAGSKPESKLWFDFWIPFFELDKISYVKFESQDTTWSVSEDDISSCEVIAIAINAIDDIVHTSLNYQDLNERLNRCFENLLPALQKLTKMGFNTFITADHGFRRCKGRKYYGKTIFMNTKGSRFFISEREEEFSGIVVKGNNYGFKESEYIYLSSNSLTFSKFEKVFDHGGITIQECFIPFVEIAGKEGIE
jgi:hypothetical protein